MAASRPGRDKFRRRYGEKKKKGRTKVRPLHFALGFFAGAGVGEGDHTFGEGFVFEEGELALREAAGEERDAFADQDRNDADIKLVDQIFFEEVAGELAAAHQ